MIVEIKNSNEMKISIAIKYLIGINAVSKNLKIFQSF